MARPEKVQPWAATAAAAREPYPRRNVYFIGEGQQDVYDYLTWRSKVRGYTTVDGLPARGSMEMVNDILRRQFLKDMLDQSTAEEFYAWRRSELERAGVVAEEREPLLALAPQSSAAIAGAANADPKFFMKFMRTRFEVTRVTRVVIWNAQQGRCGSCKKQRYLKVYRIADDSLLTASFADLIAVCKSCHRKYASALAKPIQGQSKALRAS